VLHVCLRVENEDREPDQTLLAALEAHAYAALRPPNAPTTGPASLISPNWGTAVEPELVANLGRYRRYDYTSLRDLLRVVSGSHLCCSMGVVAAAEIMESA
jgi:serine/threonine-protein kinase/endoribonuclease IRE1